MAGSCQSAGHEGAPCGNRITNVVLSALTAVYAMAGLGALTDGRTANLGAFLGTVAAHLDTVTTAYDTLKADYSALKDQVDWFKRQLFGRHSEKRLEYDLTEQASAWKT